MSNLEKVNKDPSAEERTLQRGIQPWHVSLIALGGIIGSCYFLGAGYTVMEVGPAVIFAYGIGGFLIYFVMRSFAELLVNIPRRGSFVAYTKEFMGPAISCGSGWAYWINWVAYCPAEALACGIMVNAIAPNIPVFLPGMDDNVFLYSIVALLMITLINIFQVSWFGHIESVLSILKIFAVVVFSVCAVGVIFGLIGGKPIGLSIIYNPLEGLYDSLFPFGAWQVVVTMVFILVNFQGSEIVGLSAAETQDPEKNIPLACKRVAVRIIGIYIIPLFLLVFIIPYAEAGLQDSVFSIALAKYGLEWAAVFFSLITMVAAFSCANSGVYGTVRCLYGLSAEGLAPKAFLRLNRFNVPQIATIFTIAPMWIVMALGYYNEQSSLYAWLLAMSGFTGTICWICIILSQMSMRRKLKKRGYNPDEVLKAKTIGYPFMPALAAGIMIFGLIFMVFDPEMIPVFFMALAWTVVPMIIYALLRKSGRIQPVTKLGADEVSFDEKYPDLTKQ